MASPPKSPTAPPPPQTPQQASQNGSADNEQAVASPASGAPPATQTSPTSPSSGQYVATRQRTNSSSNASTRSRLRSASIKILDANPPPGMWHATGSIAARAPTLSDIRRGNYKEDGWSAEGQQQHREERARRRSSGASEGGGTFRRKLSRTTSSTSSSSQPFGSRRIRTATDLSSKADDIHETHDEHRASFVLPNRQKTSTTEAGKDVQTASDLPNGEAEGASDASPDFRNGYVPPPKKTWKQSTAIGLKAFWRFFLTPLGFAVTVYGLNVVAWGGMLFLLLCNAAPAMCHPNCDDINSPRRVWVEIDSQILNALFCVTGFGLIPWRFRDLFYLIKWRVMKRHAALQRLAGIHRGWFRLQGSENLPYVPASALPNSDKGEHNIPEDLQASIPIPGSKIPDPPPTGTRASPTALWKLDFVILMYVGNTFLQAVLSGFMWGLNRYNRPSWSTGLFVALACIVAGIAGLVVFFEGKRVKKFEGVPEGLPAQTKQATVEDVEKAQT